MSARMRHVINGISVILALIPLFWLLVQLPALPERIPVHFGAADIPDRWGSKYELLLVGFLAPLILGICLASQRFDFSNLPARYVTRAQRADAVAGIGLASVLILDAASFYVFSLVLANL